MSARRPIVAGNWKMNTTIAEGLALVDSMLPGLQAFDRVEKVVCPPFVSLAALAVRLQGTDVFVGAQNLHPEPQGAYTGEVSPKMLVDLVRYVIVGHSERRQCFCEDDAFVNRKVRAALAAGLTPIMCVGERLDENERDETEEVVTRQTRAGLEGVEDVSRVVIAYEPIWAIGTGRAATPELANSTIHIIRDVVRTAAGPGAADAIRIQYGGSVTAENFGEYIRQPHIDGALVGGASLKAEQFVEIVKLAQHAA